MKIGVLACQEYMREHIQAIAGYGLVPVEIRSAADLNTDLQGLIISGEDGPVFKSLLSKAGLLEKIKEKADSGLVIYGINEGAVVLQTLGLMNISVERKDVKEPDSSEASLAIPALGEKPVKVKFTGRPPVISRVEPNVGIICARGDDIMMARQGNFLASTFHPGFNEDRRVYEYFFKMVKDAKLLA